MKPCARILDRRCWAALSLAALSVVGPSAARADVITWDNSAGDMRWSGTSPTNWDLDRLPTPEDMAVFGNIGVGTINFTTLTAHSGPPEILLQNTVGAYEFAGQLLEVDRITQTGNSSTFRVSNLNANRSGLVLDVQANTLALDASIRATGLTKKGAGTLILERSTWIVGSTYIQDGLLVAGALGAAGTNVFLDGGDVRFDSSGYSGSNYTVREDATLTIDSNFATSISLLTIDDAEALFRGIGSFHTTTYGTLINGTGLAVLDAGIAMQLGRLTLNQDLALSGTGAVVAGPLAGAGRLRTTAAALMLSATHSGFTGSLVVDGGMMTVGASNAAGGRPVTVNNDGVVTVTTSGGLLNSAVSLNGASQLRLNTGSALDLATVTVNDQARVVAAASGALSKSTIRLDGGTLELVGPGYSYGGVVEVPATSAIEIGTAGSFMSWIGDVRLGDATLTARNNTSHTLNVATLSVNGTGLARVESAVKELAFGPATLNANLTLDGAGSFSFNGLSGAGSITKLGAGGLKLNATAQTSQTGAMLVEEGIVTLASSLAFRGAITVNDGGTVALTSTNASAGPITINAGGILEAGSGHLTNTAVTLSGGKLRLKGMAGGAVNVTAPSTIELAQSGSVGVASVSLAGQPLTIGGLAGPFITAGLTAAGTASSSVSAPGVQLTVQKLTLDQDLSITAGFTAINSLAGAGSLTLDAPTNNLANPALFTGSITVNSGKLVMGGGSSALWLQSEITANNAAQIQATGGMAFANATMTLNGTSQFIAGATDSLSGGSVTANAGTLVDAKSLNALRNATVRLAGGRALVRSNSGGQFRIVADSTIEMGSTNKVQSITLGDSTLTIDGLPTELLEGALAVEGAGLAKLIVPGSAWFNPVTVGAELTIDGAGSVKLAGLNGAGTIVKQGTGTLELLAPIDAEYSGGLQILGGAVKVSAANAVRGDVKLDAGKLITAAADAVNGRTITLRNGGELESTIANGLRGSTIDFEGGTLRLNAPGNASNGGHVRLAAPTTIIGMGGQGLNSLTLGDQTLTLGNTGTFNFDDGVTVNGTGLAKIVGGPAPLRLGRLTLNDDLDVAANSDVAVGPLSGSGTLTTANARFYSIAAASGFTGQIILTGGSYRSAVPSSLGAGTITATNATVTANAPQGFSGSTIIINPGATLNASGSGALQGAKVFLNGPSTTWCNAISVQESEITANAGASLNLTLAGSNELSSAQLHLNGGTLSLRAPYSYSAGGTVDLLADSTIDVRPVTTGNAATLTLGSIILGDQTLNVIGTSGSTYILGAAFTVNGTGQATLNASAKVTGAFTLNDDLLITGNSAVAITRLSGGGTLVRRSPAGSTTISGAAQDFTGGLALEEGSLTLTNSDALKGGQLLVNGGTATATGAYALRGASVSIDAGTLYLNTSSAATGASGIQINGGLLSVAARSIDAVPVTVNAGGTLEATAQDALGAAAINLAGGTLTLRRDLTTTFGGTVNVTADSTISTTRLTNFSTISHGINVLSLNDNLLNVTNPGGLPASPILFAATEVNIGGTGSAAINNTGGISLARVTLGSDLTVSGTGRGTLAPLAGSGDLRFIGSGSYTVRKETASTWSGELFIDGGSVGADTPNALTGAHITINSGGTFFATVSQAAPNSIIDIYGGTLSAGSPLALQGATVNYHSGEVQSTGGAAVNILPGATMTLRSANGGPFTLAGGTLELVRESYASPTNYTTAVTLAADSVIHLNNQLPTWTQPFQINALIIGDQTLDITASAASTLQTYVTFNVAGTGQARINSAANFGNGYAQATLNAGLTTGGAGAFTFNALRGSGSLNHRGPGDLTLTNSYNHTGAISISGGTLRGFGAGPVTVNTGGRVLVSSGIGNGGITLAGGTLQLRPEVGYVPPGGGLIRSTGNSTLEITPPQNLPWTTNVDLLNLTLDAGTLAITNTNNGQATVVSFTVAKAGAIRNNTVVTSPFEQPAGLRLSRAVLDEDLTIAGTGDTALMRLSGPGRIIMNGTGTLVIQSDRNSDNRNWSGNLIINSGTVALRGDTNYNGMGSSTLPLSVQPGATLSVDGIGRRYYGEEHAFTRPIILSGAGDEGAGALFYGGETTARDGVIAAPVNLAAPTTIAIAGKMYDGVLHIGDPAGELAGGALNGTGPLTKIGGHELLGMLQINVPAAYTGGTVIEAGGIGVGPLGSLVGTGGITVKPNALLRVEEPAGTNPSLHSATPRSVSLLGGSLVLIGDLDPAPFLAPNSTGGSIALADSARDINFAQLLPGLPASAWKLGAASRSGGSYTGTIRFDEPSTLTLGGGGGKLTITGGLKAANNIAALTVDGSGTYILAGQNDYAGDTTIIAGTLQIADTAALGPSAAPVYFGGAQASTAGAKLELAAGTTFTRDILVRDTAKGASISVSTEESDAPVTVTGNITVNGQLAFGYVPTKTSMTVHAVIDGAGRINQYGGRVILTANNTFTGPLSVYGSLDASTTANRALGNSTSISVYGGGVISLASSASYAPGAVFTAYTAGVVSIPTNEAPAFSADSTGVLAIEHSSYNAVNDISLLGGGRMFLGSTTNGVFSGALLPGAEDIYRLGGGGGTISFGPGALADTDKPVSLLVGPAWYDVNGRGIVRLAGDNSFTGTTTVQNGVLLAGDSGRILGGSTAITIESQGALHLLAATNCDPAASIKVRGIVSVGGDFLPPVALDSDGVFAVDVDGYTALNSFATLGNGGMFLSSMTSGSLHGPLEAGAGGVWQFGGAGGTLRIATNLADAPSLQHRVTVGRSGRANNGTIILAGVNTFTGPITVQSDADLSITGTVASPIKLQGSGTLRLLNSQTLTLIEAGGAAVEVGDGVSVIVQSMTSGNIRDGGGTLDILSYSRGSTGSLEHRAGQTLLRGNAGTAATPAAYAIARLRPDMRGGMWNFLASQDLDDLLVDETAPLARAILGSGVELRLYDNATSDGIGPSREMIERLWIDVISGYGQGGSGIDLDPAIDRSMYALGLLLAKDAKLEPHALLKPVPHGDIDGSGLVDKADAAIMLASYSAMTPESASMYTWLEGDLTFDGLLNEYDIGALAAAMKYPYAPSAGPAAALAALQRMANVPEPSAVVLLLPALMLRRRRR